MGRIRSKTALSAVVSSFCCKLKSEKEIFCLYILVLKKVLVSKMATQNPAQLSAAQRQVEEVTDIMRTNVEKVMERDGKLGDLSQRAEDLEVGTAQFKTAANRIQRKHFWENMKMKIIIGVVISVIVIIIIIVASS